MAHGTAKKKEREPWYVHLIAGGVAGCVAKTVVAPLDRVKILFQTKSPHYAYRGVFGTLQGIVEREGWTQLYRGNVAQLVRVFPYAAIQFMAFEQFERFFATNEVPTRPRPLQHLATGAMAGTTAVAFTYPLDLIRARLAAQVTEKTYRNSFHGLALMWREEGPRSWFRGMRATIQGIVPYSGVNFMVYETLKFYAPKNENGDLSLLGRLFCGGIAGPIGQTVAYPWDTVRRRQQTWGFAPGTKSVEERSSFVVMREIVRTEGMRALFKGISINYMKATPTVGITFMVYETLKGVIAPKRPPAKAS